MLRLWKAVIALAALVLWFFLGSLGFLPKVLWVLVFIIVVTYGISLSVNMEIPIYRRSSIAYLVFVGLSYLVAGIFGVNPNGGLIAASAWYSLISPYPLLALLKGCVSSHPCDIYRLSYPIFPVSDREATSFSLTVIVFSLIAIVAAFAMAKNKRWAYGVWLVLVALSILEAIGYGVAQFAKWGMPQYEGPNDPTQTILSLCWSGSYVIAYVMARRGADLRKVNTP